MRNSEMEINSRNWLYANPHSTGYAYFSVEQNTWQIFWKFQSENFLWNSVSMYKTELKNRGGIPTNPPCLDISVCHVINFWHFGVIKSLAKALLLSSL